MAEQLLVIHDPPDAQSATAPDRQWRLITDDVMGGVSRGRLDQDTVDGRHCTRLRGEVSLINNGGFIQAALDIGDEFAADASTYNGIVIEVYGNNESYGLHLRTTNLWLPWQSYRAEFVAPAQWTTIKLPFDRFRPYKTRKTLDVSRLKRIGLFAIGREFTADIRVGRVALYRAEPDQ
jgi:hypothetical protein